MSTTVGKNVTLEKPDDFGKLLQDEGIIFTQLDKAVNWARKSSIWPLAFGLGLLRDRDDVDGRRRASTSRVSAPKSSVPRRARRI